MVLLMYMFLAIVLMGCINTVQWPKLHARYSILDGFYKIPLTTDEIGDADEDTSGQGAEYALLEKDYELNVDVYSYPQDPRVCLLYDSYGNIAGIRLSYIKDDIQKQALQRDRNFTYDYSKISMFKENIYWGKKLWSADVLFVTPEKLDYGGRSETYGQVAEGIYVKLEGRWIEIPKNECIVENLGFIKQGCHIGMGMHYFYKLNEDLKCKNFEPFFALYSNTQLVGFGIIPFGSFTNKDGGREWFEDVPVSLTKKIIPIRPACLSDWIENYGVTSLHFFLTGHPLLTLCSIPVVGRFLQKHC